jgi:hypothetical protein
LANSVYRVLIDARPLTATPIAPGLKEHAVISVVLPAGNAKAAQTAALAMLPHNGWLPLGSLVRTSNLTQLLSNPHQDAFDSAFGDYALQWLQIAHEEALAEGASLHLLSVDYEYLDQPRPLRRSAGL